VIVVPAIDLRDGRCVRLREGRADAETVFSDDPVAMARRWAELGASRLHVVDLDGAFAGAPQQTGLIGEIVRAVAPVPVEVGGGLRDADAVDSVLAAGARWAVVGTRATLDPRFLEEICAAHDDGIIVAVDARGNRVAVKGWTETSDLAVVDVGRRALDAGAAALLYTDVSRDGTGLGPNVADTEALARAIDLPILASGGVASIDDLVRLAAIPGVTGTIVGRALYMGAIDLRDAIDALSSSAGSTEETRTREASEEGVAPVGRTSAGEVRKGGGAPLREKKRA
jgi:phosphoribosylformimino-5-aminoimidazole carboxamide ribotide isomerase